MPSLPSSHSPRPDKPTSADVLFLVDYRNNGPSLEQVLTEAASITVNYQTVKTNADLERLLRLAQPHLILCDFTLVAPQPTQVMHLIQQLQPGIPLLLVAKQAALADAVDMMRLGARGLVQQDDVTRLLELIRAELTAPRLNGASPPDSALPAAQPVVLCVENHPCDSARYRSILNHQSELICRYDPDFRLTFANHAYCTWIGQPVEALIGTGFLDRIPVGERDQAVAHVRALTIEQPVAVSLHSSISPTGVQRLFEWTDHALFDDTGTLIEYQAVGRDVTDLKQAESTLHYQAGLLQQVSDAIIATDAQIRITAWNRAATSIYGWTEEEALGQSIDDLLHTEWLEQSQDEAQVALQRHGQWQGEIRQQTRTGEPLYIMASVSVLHNEQGEFIGGVTVNRDITARRRQEILQRQISAILEEVTEAKPLSAILDRLVLVVEEYQPGIKASVLLLNRATGQLRHGAAPSLPEVYTQAIDGLPIGPQVGSCGTAAYEKRLVIVENIETDPLWDDYRQYALPHGLRACWSQPIMADDNTVFGTFALYYHTPRYPTAAELELIQLAAHIAGIAIRRQQAADELRESTDWMRMALEASEQGTWQIDLRTNIVRLDERARTHYAINEPTVSIEQVLDRLHPDDAARLGKEINTALDPAGTGRFTTEYRVLHPDGSLHWLAIYVSVYFTGEGDARQPAVGFGTTQDITARKLSDEALRVSEEKYRSLIESTDAVIAMFDEQGRALFGNEIAARALHLTPETIIGRSMHELFPPVTADYQLESIRDVMRTGVGVVREALTSLAGEERWHRTSIQPVRDASGKIVAGLINSADITRFKMAEIALRQSEDLFRRFMDNLSGTVFIFDDQERLTYCNRAYAETLKLQVDDILGKPFSEFLPQDLVAAVRAENAEVLADGRGSHEFDQLSLETGLPAYWRIIKFTIPRQDLPPLIGGIGLEVTTQKQAEAALRASEQRYRQIFEVHGLPKLLLDFATGQIMDANPAAARFYGYDIATLKTLTLYDISLSPADEVATTLGKARHENLLSCTFIHRAADQQPHDVELFTGSLEIDGKPILYVVVTDVTEKRRAKTALEEAHHLLEQRVMERTAELAKVNDRLEAIFQHSGDAILLLDVAEGIQQANYAFGQMFGMTSDAFQGGKLTAYIHPADVAIVETAIEAAQSRHQTHQVEAKALRADGSELDIEISLAAVNRSSRAVTSLVCIIRDITERRQAQLALQKYAAEVHDLYNNAPTGYHSVDPQSLFVQMNDTELRWLGYTRDEVVGKLRFSDVITPAGMATFRENFPRFKAQGWIKDVEFEMVRKDGSTFFVIMSATAIYDEQGNFLHSRSTIFDITELRQVQQAMAEERNLLRTLIDAIPDHIYVKDTQHRMLLTNLAAARYLNSEDPDTIIGKTVAELLPPDIAAKFHVDEAQLFATGQPVRKLEARPSGANHRESWAQTTKVPLRNLDGEIIGLVGITHDVSAIKASEAALRRSQADLLSVIDSTSTAFILVDREGVIRVCNQLARTWSRQFLGSSLAEGMHILNVLEPAFREKFKHRFARVLDGETISFEGTSADTPPTLTSIATTRCGPTMVKSSGSISRLKTSPAAKWRTSRFAISPVCRNICTMR